MQHSLFYAFLFFIVLFGLGDAVSTAEEEDDLLNQYNHLFTAVFVDQPLASPKSANFKYSEDNNKEYLNLWCLL